MGLKSITMKNRGSVEREIIAQREGTAVGLGADGDGDGRTRTWRMARGAIDFLYVISNG